MLPFLLSSPVCFPFPPETLPAFSPFQALLLPFLFCEHYVINLLHPPAGITAVTALPASLQPVPGKQAGRPAPESWLYPLTILSILL